eukprot:m.149504 g.149504  ORF g.149504 m.149504 type:complete len:632 (-) comp15014_c0_seq2:2304-4199(-)
MDVDEEDPVVQEHNVYLSQELADRLYLLQYPLRPRKRPYGNTKTKPQVRVKPEQDKLEMKFELNTNSNTYDREKGKEIAEEAGQTGPSSTVHMRENSTLMDAHVLRSTKVPMRTHYVTGIWKDDGLHLTPLKAILQLRPSFDHLNDIDKKKQDKGKDALQASEGTEEKPVNLIFKRIENEKTQAARKRSHNYMQQQSDAEAWINVEYHSKDSHQAATARRDLLAKQSNRKMEYEDGNDAWLAKLTDPTFSSEYAEPLKQTNNMPGDREEEVRGNTPLYAIRKMPLGQQIQTLMTQAEIMQFATIASFVTSNEETSILNHLEDCAWLVQGAWIIKSMFVAPKEGKFTSSGTSSLMYMRGRDYILQQFYLKKKLIPQDIISCTKLTAEDTKIILRKFGVLRVQSDGRSRWEFRYPEDSEFFSRYPRAIQRQAEEWETRSEQILSDLTVDVPMESQDANNDNFNNTNITLPAGMKSAPKVAFADTISLTDGASANIHLQEITAAVLQQHGICSILTLQDLAVEVFKSKGLPHDVSENDVRTSLDAIGTKTVSPAANHGGILYVLADPPHKDAAPYVDLILGLYEKTVKIKRSDINKACTDAGLKVIPTNVYQKIMHEFAEKAGNHWVLKSGRLD